VDMARDNRRILNAIMVIVNECLGILGEPQLDLRQRAVLIRILSGMARKTAPLETPFNRRLLNVVKMNPGVEQKHELARLLGLGAMTRFPTEIEK
jgi:hypothetical protein